MKIKTHRESVTFFCAPLPPSLVVAFFTLFVAAILLLSLAAGLRAGYRVGETVARGDVARKHGFEVERLRRDLEVEREKFACLRAGGFVIPAATNLHSFDRCEARR